MTISLQQILKYFPSGAARNEAKQEFDQQAARIKKWNKQGKLNEPTQEKQYRVAAYQCTNAIKGSEDLCRQDTAKWVDQLLSSIKK